MKWRVTPKPIINYLDWHPFFTWKPVQFGDYKYWLCFVNRKAVWHKEVDDANTVNQIIDKCGCKEWEYTEHTWYY